MKKFLSFLLLFLLLTASFNCPKAMATNSSSSSSSGNSFNDDITKYRLEDYLCTVLRFLTGGVGKSLAAFACIGVSLAFVGGKVAWTTILAFALGMACIFGAPQIIKAFAGGEMACSEATTVGD